MGRTRELWHGGSVHGLRVTALELPARFGEPERALADVEALLARGPETDLALLPEASVTGYVSTSLDADLRRFAEPLSGPTAAHLARIARARGIHLVGPLVLKEDGGTFNAMVAFAPDGGIACVYRKRHPWYVETWATPGTGPLGAFEIAGARVAIAICFDVHFLADESAADLHAADVLLFASAWVEKEDSRPETLASLARTFDLGIVNANWGPGLPRVHGQGGSRIVGRDGAALSIATPGEGPKRIDATLQRR
jgi:predicted amidohydrolase